MGEFVLHVSIYGFWGFGVLPGVFLVAAYAVHYGALSRILAYMSVSASTAAIACMFDVAVLLGRTAHPGWPEKSGRSNVPLRKSVTPYGPNRSEALPHPL